MSGTNKKYNTIEFTNKQTRTQENKMLLTGGVISSRKEGWHIRVDCLEDNKSENRELAQIVIDMPGATWTGNIQ